jgi:hypothetical protein
MKRNQILGMKLLGFSLAIPLLIVVCAGTSLVSYLAFSSLGAAAGGTAPDSGPVRIRTLPGLAPVAPAPVTNESDLHLTGVIEEAEPEPIVEIEAPPVVEAPAEPVIEAETSAEPPVEEAGIAPEPVPTQDEAAEPTKTIVSEAAPLDAPTTAEGTAAGPENGSSPPVEDLSMVEAPAEPIIVEPVQPEMAANPAPPPQKEPPAPAAPSEPTFVPDSSFFDQLLEQVD